MATKKKRTAKKIKKKVFDLVWLTESWVDAESYYEKRMFGGLCLYLYGKMMVFFAESPGERSYRGTEYSFDIWNGILLPLEREHHPSLQESFPQLIPHPVLTKWLYLPLSAKNFEGLAQDIVQSIEDKDQRFGIVPKSR